MTNRQPTTRRGWWRLLLAAIAAALVTLLGVTSASAATVPELETRVGASTPTVAHIVGVHESVSAGQRWGNAPPQAETVVATGVAANTAEEGTTLFRGVASDHNVFQEALNGEAWPGDVFGHTNGAWHAAGLTEDSSLTSWTTSRAVAERFATNEGTTNGVILRTTLEQQAGRIVPGPNNLGESEVLLRGVIQGLPVEEFP